MEKVQKSPTSVSILGVNITSISKPEVLTFIHASLKGKRRISIVTPNPEMIVESQKNTPFLMALNSADMAIADGTGLLIAERVLYKTKHLIRIPGRILMEELLQEACENNWSVFFLGASNAVNNKALKLSKKRYPQMRIEGSSGMKLDKEGKPVSEIDRLNQIDTIKRINTFKPDLLFVAFGAPKQELWIKEHKNELNAGVLIGVGGALDYYTGEVSPAPSYASALGFEWLWRLYLQPKRYKRILNALVVFPFMVCKQALYGTNR